MDVTVGKYVPNNSFIHRLDPRIKLITNIIFIVMAFVAQSFIMVSFITGTVLIAFVFSKLKYKQLLKTFIPVLIIGGFIFLVNVFVIEGNSDGVDVVYASWWKITISDLAVQKTLILVLRIYTMIVMTTLLTATTKPMELTKAIEFLIYPLKLLFVPVNIIAMIISIALRFIPTLLEESQRIMKAQSSRGVDFKNGGIKAKSKATITLIIPLFVSAFGKAEDLANAMETRGYDPYEKRTSYRKYTISFFDILLLLWSFGIIAIIILQKEEVLHFYQWK